jgi:hypothetical protein
MPPPEPFYLNQVRPVEPPRARERPAPPALQLPRGRESSASHLNVALLAANCTNRLAEAGIYVEQTSDFDLAMRAIEMAEKPYLTDFLSPRKNDFFEDNCFWLVFNDADGEPGGVIGSRFDQTGHEPLSSYACRKLRNIFPDEDHVPIRPDRLPRVADEIMGGVVYTGDLFLGPALRTTNRANLRLIMLLQYCVIYLKWKDFDWLYAFLRDRDVRRGATWMYHFPRTYPMAHSWTSPPSDQSGDNWLAAMSRLEMVDLFAAYLAAPNRL